MKHFLNILDPARKKLLPKLSFTTSLKLYLAGGTALGFKLGHRKSLDFDFYRAEKFKKGELSLHFEKAFSDKRLKFIRNEDNTFQAVIDEIELSCFYYPYPLLKEFSRVGGINVASIEDIAAMKIVAVIQRGTYRDFIDVYYLIRKCGLEKIFEFTSQKYKTFDVYSGLRSLIYFDDADKGSDEDKKRIKVFDKSLSWDKVKKYITDEVVKYQRQFIKNET